MILAVDAGNSRVKWALHDGHQFLGEGWVSRADVAALDAQWRDLPAPSVVAIANVAGEETGSRLRKLAARWNCEPVFIAGARRQGGVSNGYDDPSQLGPDRWAALIGAHHLVGGDCLITNVGTAMTVDVLTAAGEFLGGIIVPGLDLMHDALAEKTARLSPERGKAVRFPRSTRDAITSGAIHALCGAVERMRREMIAAGHPEPTLVFGGGAADLVVQQLGRPARIVDKLVLEGLVRIAMESR